MRRSGSVDTVTGLRTADHLCWGYRDAGDFPTQTAAFLGDRLVAGDRIVYFGHGTEPRLRGDLAGVPGIARAPRENAAAVGSRHGDDAGPIDPGRQVTEAAETTPADGLPACGSPPMSPASPPTTGTETRSPATSYTSTAGHRVTGMCTSDRGAVGEDGFADLASVHPPAQPGTTPFHFHAPDDPAVSAVLAGEFNSSTRERFAATPRRAEIPVIGGAVVIDARELSFIDHRGLSAVADARTHGTGSVTMVSSAHSPLARLAQLLDIPGSEVPAV